MKKYLCLLLAIAMVLSCSSVCFAAVNGGMPVDVTEDMSTASYWTDIAKKGTFGGTKVLMTLDEIAAMNEKIAGISSCHLVNFDSFVGTYDASALRVSLSKVDTPSYDVYIDGAKINKESYFNRIREAISSTGYFDSAKYYQYAVATAYADIKAIPTAKIICDSLTDTADEMQSSSLLPGEPFVVLQKCEFEGKRFYYGHSDNCSGWVDSEKLAICSSREEWLDAWKIDDINGKDFIVVCDDKIALEKSMDASYPADTKLMMGTVLKLVPKDLVPEKVAERGTWYNYVVYLPTRDANGRYVKTIALISQHNSISVGYVPYTEENVMKLSFAWLGNRYGWGNMFEDLDCSGYVRNIYRCMGMRLPRNTTWQSSMTPVKIDVSGLSDEAKLEILKQVPVGSPMYFPGHAVIYTGMKDGVPFCISSASSLSDSETSGDVKITKILAVMLTPMTVRRTNGTTWLRNIHTIIAFPNISRMTELNISAEKYVGDEDAAAKVVVSSNGKNLRLGKDYTLEFTNGNAVAVATASSGRSGAVRTQITSLLRFTDVPVDAEYYSQLLYDVEKGLLLGTSKGLFRPDSVITEYMADLIYQRIYGEEYDVETANWLVPGETTRAQAAVLIYDHVNGK